jgi:hypothetical protein
MLPFLVPVLSTIYIQGVLNIKKNSGAKGLKAAEDSHQTEHNLNSTESVVGVKHFTCTGSA